MAFYSDDIDHDCNIYWLYVEAVTTRGTKRDLTALVCSHVVADPEKMQFYCKYIAHTIMLTHLGMHGAMEASWSYALEPYQEWQMN